MIFGNVDVSLREALDKGWQNGGKRWQTGGKRWQNGGKLLTSYAFVFYMTLLWWNLGVRNTVVENKKGLLYYEYGVFLHREQGYSQRTKFLKQVWQSGVRCLSKLRKERSLDHLGRQRGGGAHTGPLPGRRGFLYRSGDRPRGGFRYRCGNEGLLFSQRWTQVGSQGLLLELSNELMQ